VTDTKKLIRELAAQEEASRREPFVAPCVPGSRLRTRVAGMVQTYRPEPRDFVGWGLFRALDVRRARLEREAEVPEVDTYLERMPALRVWLVRELRDERTWLAVASNLSDARQRFGNDQPMVVRLVHAGAALERVLVRHDGASWWYQDEDRRADPVESAELRDQLTFTPPDRLERKGLTPELRYAYALAHAPDVSVLTGVPVSDRDRLEGALRVAGGALRDYRDQGDFFWVEWTTADGQAHQSAIAKSDLTVITAGICLNETDATFDLQSLVGVIQGAWDEDW